VGHGREGSVVACWLRGAWGMAGNVLPDVVETAWSREPLKMRFHGSKADGVRLVGHGSGVPSRVTRRGDKLPEVG